MLFCLNRTLEGLEIGREGLGAKWRTLDALQTPSGDVQVLYSHGLSLPHVLLILNEAQNKKEHTVRFEGQ